MSALDTHTHPTHPAIGASMLRVECEDFDNILRAGMQRQQAMYRACTEQQQRVREIGSEDTTIKFW